MSVCTSNTETITNANYSVSYASTSTTARPRTSCLPGGEGWTGSDISSSTGLVSTASVDAHIASLISNIAKAPEATISESATANTLSQVKLNSASEFSSKSQLLRSKIDDEYCYYFVRYNWALRELLKAAVDTTTDTNSASYITLKTNTENINRKLNQILQILQSIVNNRLSTLHTYYGSGDGVNKLNDNLNIIRTRLQNDSKNLKDSQMETNVKTAMMDYTIEKNNSSRNLLAVYGFLNIVAIGMIYYLYRNAKA